MATSLHSGLFSLLAALAVATTVGNSNRINCNAVEHQQNNDSGLSTSTTAGNGRVSSQSSGGSGVSVQSGNGGVSASAATTGAGGNSTTVTSSNGNCSIDVTPSNKED